MGSDHVPTGTLKLGNGFDDAGAVPNGKLERKDDSAG